MSIDFVNKTNTPKSEKDSWQTPKDIFKALSREFDFRIDVCASKENALCEHFFTEEDSALENSWSSVGGFFINPPYSQTQEFLREAALQAEEFNLTGVALVNANTDTKWFADAFKSANEIRLISGRVAFVKPDGKKASGNPKGQCLIIWRGKCSTPCVISVIDRDELIASANE